LNNFPNKNTGGYYIRDTCRKGENGKKLFCPFLNMDNGIAGCSIHDTKPVTCRDAPYGSVEFDCCPAFKKPAGKVWRDLIVKRQSRDFRKAFDDFDTGKKKLLGLLHIARTRLQRGN
jgi:hypothetical protein